MPAFESLENYHIIDTSFTGHESLHFLSRNIAPNYKRFRIFVDKLLTKKSKILLRFIA